MRQLLIQLHPQHHNQLLPLTNHPQQLHLLAQQRAQFLAHVQVDHVQVTIHLLQLRVHRALVTIHFHPVAPDHALVAE